MKNIINLKNIEIRYSDGSGVRVVPYRLTKDDHGYKIQNPRTDFGLEHYNKRGRVTEYEGGWRTEQLTAWLTEVIEFENVDLDKEFEALEQAYGKSKGRKGISS